MKYLLLVVWTLATGILTYRVFYLDELLRRQGEPLGSISSIKGEVKIQPVGSVQQYGARENLNLLGYDMIRTGAKSAAIIKFIDGSSIRLGENSQMKLLAKKSYSNEIPIYLLRGSIRAKRAKPGGTSTGAKKHLKLAINQKRRKFVLANEGASLGLSDDSAKAQTKGVVDVVSKAIDLEKLDTKFAMHPVPSTITFKPVTKPSPPSLKPPMKLKAMIKKPTKILLSKPDKNTAYPKLSPENGLFWTVRPPGDAFRIPLPIRYTYDKRKVSERWQPSFRVNLSGKVVEFTDLVSDSGQITLPFSKRESKNPFIENLQIFPGYLINSELEERDMIFSDRNYNYKIGLLATQQSYGIGLENHIFGKKPSPWLALAVKQRAPSYVYLKNGHDFTRLEYLLSNKNYIAIDPSYSPPRQGVFVYRDGQVIGYFRGKAPNENEARLYLHYLKADIIFSGSQQAILGSKGTLDVAEYLQGKSDLYYIHRGRTIRLDPSLFKSHGTAKKFLDEFNSFFLREPVTILAQKSLKP